MQRVLNTQSLDEPRAEPIAEDEFAALLNPLLPAPPPSLAIAVSGGPDSMALAYCIKRWSEKHSTTLIALIVDHALRPESGVEAEATQKNLARLGITSEILRWEHARVTTRLHDTARKARYRLLLDACDRHGLQHLLLAHQIEDQAETILMRFAKGSGIAGLAGMAANSQKDGVTILRPFLHLPKQRLIATCKTARVPFITDASNASDKYARGRLRRVMPALQTEGMTVERLADLGARAADANEALEHYATVLLRVATRMDVTGAIRFDLEQLRSAPRATASRAIAICLQTIHAGDYAPQHAPLMRLVESLRGDEETSPLTLHGCLITKTAAQIQMMREVAGITEVPILRAGESVIWDGRWRVTVPEDIGEDVWQIKPLGHPPHDIVDQLAPDLRRQVPQGRLRATLPSLWRDGQLGVIPSFLPVHNHAIMQLVSAIPGLAAR